MKKIIFLIIALLSTVDLTFAAQRWENELEQMGQNTNMLIQFFSIEMLINVLFALVAIIMTFFISKIVDSKIIKFAESNGDSENREELVWVLTRTANISILAIWFSITLWILWVDMWIFMWGLWFGLWFTLKIFLSNFIAWVIMVTQWSYHNWDIIEIEWTLWTIKKINALFTEVEKFDGVIFIVPNVKFLENNVQNFHRNDKRRVDIQVWVDYNTDIVKAKKVMLQVIDNFPGILKSPDSSVYITKFDDSAINLSLRFWISSKWKYFEMKSNVTETINLAFKQYWINIPFPQITLSNRSDFKINMSTNK